jgi:uridine monophosphate synthetase
LDPLQQEIAIELLELGCVQFGEFQLKSGKLSPVYLDLRRLIHRPKLMEKVASAYQKLLSALVFDHLAALPYAALPITTAVSLIGSWSMIYPRKEVKKYGTEAAVEGLFQEGDRVVVVDDLITTGGSKLEAIQRLERKKLQVKDIVVLIDRSPQAADQLAAKGYRLHSYLKLEQLLDFYQNKELIEEDRIQEVRQFLLNSE